MIKAVSFAIILWLIGFAWGSIVYMAPSLKAASPIPMVSSNPWISFPILLAWLPASWLLARNHLRSVTNPRREGFRLGLVFSTANFALDLLVLVVILQAGLPYFASLSVWAGYALLLLVPSAVARSVTPSVVDRDARPPSDGQASASRKLPRLANVRHTSIRNPLPGALKWPSSDTLSPMSMSR